jgi:hypothetical protein
MNIDKYINQIKVLIPMVSGFVYNAQKWQQLSVDHKILVSDFEDTYISRADVIKEFNNYYSGNGDCVKAFLLTMIWGFGDTGYGTYRTNSYLANAENKQIIKDSVDAVKKKDLKFAFDNLTKIKGLGVSYITKVLYFSTKGAGIKEYALIFDIRVANALVKLTSPPYIADIVKVYPSSKFEDYQNYNTLIHKLAKQHHVEPDSIELFLFDQKFT